MYWSEQPIVSEFSTFREQLALISKWIARKLLLSLKRRFPLLLLWLSHGWLTITVPSEWRNQVILHSMGQWVTFLMLPSLLCGQNLHIWTQTTLIRHDNECYASNEEMSNYFINRFSCLHSLQTRACSRLQIMVDYDKTRHVYILL